MHRIELGTAGLDEIFVSIEKNNAKLNDAGLEISKLLSCLACRSSELRNCERRSGPRLRDLC